MSAMSGIGLIGGLREPRAVTKRNWGNITDWKNVAAAHHQTPKYEEELIHVPIRRDMPRRLGAVHYAGHSLRSEVDRQLRLPLVKGRPSGSAFPGSPLNEVPSMMEAGQSTSRGRSLIASWPPSEMVTCTPLRSPSGRASDGCTFCRTNGERRSFYMSHTLREHSGPGSKGRVTCPVLRSYQCPQCGYPGGDEAHTLRYCPLNKDLSTRSVYKTLWKSNGQPRRRPCSPVRSGRHGSVGTLSPATSVSGCGVDSYKPSQPRMHPASFSGSSVDSYEPSQPRVRPVVPPRRQVSLTGKVGMRRSGVEFQR